MTSKVWIASTGYTDARDGIEAGTMHSVTARGLLLADREWIAECTMAGLDPAAASGAVIQRWRLLGMGVPLSEAPTVRSILENAS